MIQVKLTSNPGEMIRQAREIIQNNQDYYTEAVLNDLRAGILRHVENAAPEEVEEHLLLSVYHYYAFGCITDEYFYYDFAHKTPEEKQTYVTTRFKILFANQLNRVADAHILQNKNETYQLFKPYFRRDLLLCEGPSSYEAFRDFVEKHPVFVFKPQALSRGVGIRRDEVSNLSDAVIREKYEELMAENRRLNNTLIRRKGSESFIIEELIEQADEMNALYAGSVNGVRINTFLKENQVLVYQGWLKMGNGGAFTDNGAKGGLLAGMDLNTGVIDTLGYSEKPAVFTHHPDTNVQIRGFQLPEWGALRKTVQELALQLPTIPFIGWDMVYTKKGWALLEGNFRGGFMWQLVRQKGMKAEFEDLSGIHYQNHFWWELV